MLVDQACWERGCACYDDRLDKHPVEVVKRELVGLTEDEIKEIFYANGKNAQFWWEYTNPDCVALGRAIEAKLRSKNT